MRVNEKSIKRASALVVLGLSISLLGILLSVKPTYSTKKLVCVMVYDDAYSKSPPLPVGSAYDGRMWSVDGLVFGFSQYEDSIIYSTEECATTIATYSDERR